MGALPSTVDDIGSKLVGCMHAFHDRASSTLPARKNGEIERSIQPWERALKISDRSTWMPAQRYKAWKRRALLSSQNIDQFCGEHQLLCIHKHTLMAPTECTLGSLAARFAPDILFYSSCPFPVCCEYRRQGLKDLYE